MLLFLTKQAVLLETFRETQRGIAKVLGLPTSAVKVSIEKLDDGLKPTFAIEHEFVTSLPSETVDSVISKIWTEIQKPLLEKRLKHVGDRR